jgi:hypothetical protein
MQRLALPAPQQATAAPEAPGAPLALPALPSAAGQSAPAHPFRRLMLAEQLERRH